MLPSHTAILQTHHVQGKVTHLVCGFSLRLSLRKSKLSAEDSNLWLSQKVTTRCRPLPCCRVTDISGEVGTHLPKQRGKPIARRMLLRNTDLRSGPTSLGSRDTYAELPGLSPEQSPSDIARNWGLAFAGLSEHCEDPDTLHGSQKTPRGSLKLRLLCRTAGISDPKSQVWGQEFASSTNSQEM